MTYVDCFAALAMTYPTPTIGSPKDYFTNTVLLSTPFWVISWMKYIP